MIRFEVLQALRGRIFTGYITKEDGTVRNIWGQFSDKYTNQKAKQVDLENDHFCLKFLHFSTFFLLFLK